MCFASQMVSKAKVSSTREPVSWKATPTWRRSSDESLGMKRWPPSIRFVGIYWDYGFVRVSSSICSFATNIKKTSQLQEWGFYTPERERYLEYFLGVGSLVESVEEWRGLCGNSRPKCKSSSQNLFSITAQVLTKLGTPDVEIPKVKKLWTYGVYDINESYQSAS